MRYFYDCEFIEDGRTIDLISIGIVAEDGREYYAVNSDMPVDRVTRHAWLMENVVPSLPGSSIGTPLHGEDEWFWTLDRTASCVKPAWVIANEVRDFLLICALSCTVIDHDHECTTRRAADRPELWAWYGAYDHVALCQLWGAMIRLPDGIPMWTNDIRQEAERLGNPRLPEQPAGEHNALADAQHNRVRFDYLADLS